MSDFDMDGTETAWCPGCGNFGILGTLKETLSELGLAPGGVVIVSGIGQAAKTPHYLRCNFFNGLHGRALPPATGIKAANPGLTVIAESGDGDMYGEGGNHFMHAIRRNPDITNIVHNNMVYGLTKGQASPTSQQGFKTPVQVDGVRGEPFNPLAVAIALNAPFVARAYCADQERTKEIFKKAIRHRGYSLVDVLQPCVTFNKVNTYKWFRENTYYLEDSHDSGNRTEAFRRATEGGKMPLGIFYAITGRPTFEDTLAAYQGGKEPLYSREPRMDALSELIEAKRGGYA
jgi:2-oxoglutarate/2-oxoacid ferredoxin oxidoreductase subunit beta